MRTIEVYKKRKNGTVVRAGTIEVPERRATRPALQKLAEAHFKRKTPRKIWSFPERPAFA